MPKYTSKSSESALKRRKCILPRGKRKNNIRNKDEKPCKEFCTVDIKTAIMLNPKTSDKKVNELHKEGFWFFQTVKEDRKIRFTRRLSEEIKGIIKNELYWKGGRTGLIAQKPKSLDEIKKEGYTMTTYYHATDPAKIKRILTNGLLPSEVSKDLACNCGDGIYITIDKIDAIDWGLVLFKEGHHIYDKPVILEIKVPSFINVSEDPNPIEKDKYPSSYVLCTEHGIPKDFIKKASLDESEKIHFDMEYEYILEGTEYEEYG